MSERSNSLKICLFLIIFLLIGPPLSRAAQTQENAQPQSILNVHNMDINTLLKALAIKNKVNIVSDPGVSGRISLNLNQASLEDTLTAITKTIGLSWSKEGSVYIVRPRKKGEENGPRQVKTFHINYADLKELSRVIKWSFEKVRVTVCPQEKMILAEGNNEELLGVNRLINSLDVPPKQTLIEAQILEINLGDDLAYGIDWGHIFSAGQKTEGQIASPGGASFSTDLKPSDPSKFFFGLASPKFYAKLSALEKKDDVKTLAKPRLMVLDGKSAQILIGGRLGYYLITTTQTSTIQSVKFLDIGTQLKLTPHIAEDGNVLMDIHPEVSDGSLSSGLPQKTTTSVTTSVMVKAGETIFIGGLIRTSKIKSQSRLPLLGRIPCLGRILFSTASTQTQRKELVILLTPYLVSNSQQVINKKNRGEIQHEIRQWQGEIEGMSN